MQCAPRCRAGEHGTSNKGCHAVDVQLLRIKCENPPELSRMFPTATTVHLGKGTEIALNNPSASLAHLSMGIDTFGLVSQEDESLPPARFGIYQSPRLLCLSDIWTFDDSLQVLTLLELPITCWASTVAKTTKKLQDAPACQCLLPSMSATLSQRHRSLRFWRDQR